MEGENERARWAGQVSEAVSEAVSERISGY